MSKLILFILGAILVLVVAGFAFFAFAPIDVPQDEIVVEVPNSQFQ